MFGCCTCAAACASFLKRPICLASFADGERQNLQRDPAPQRHLPRFVDDAHAAAADLAHQLVIADRLHRLRHGPADHRALHLRGHTPAAA